MKSFQQYLTETSDSQHSFPYPEESHYDKNDDVFQGKTRFYVPNGKDHHGYFAKDAIVNVHPYYSNITRGKVVHIGKYNPQSFDLHYRIKLELPVKHPEAVDENGEHTPGSNIKYITHTGKELNEYNPKSTWDGR